ncbi:hypothetical protein [Clostridium uliginosum]|uniref:PD-(D/E)XK nuclease domain-containing protein n=1 Tax=Clostridium uliginosum TaxID=119641 RepID=UPI003BFA759B
MFPEATNDTGFLMIKYEIFIEKYSIIIDVKCTRVRMTERNLTEKVGSDIIHYHYINIFFFI